MTISFNGVSLTAVNYNGISLTAVIFNNVTVWTVSSSPQVTTSTSLNPFLFSEDLNMAFDMSVNSFIEMNSYQLSVSIISTAINPLFLPGESAFVFDMSANSFLLLGA